MSTAKIKVSNLPPAPKPTKAVKVGNPFHHLPGKRDLSNPDKRLNKENEIIFEVRVMDEPELGLTITTNRYAFSRAKKAALDACDTWLNSFDVTASYYFDENDLPIIDSSTMLELAIILFKRLDISAHIEEVHRDSSLIQIEDTLFVSQRANHLEKKNKRRIPSYTPIDGYKFD